MSLNRETLTAYEVVVASTARPFPMILHNAVQKRVARSLARKGWGAVEDGASGEQIFRLNQHGEDALS